MVIQESGQDYLEAILIVRNRKGTVHSKDVAQELSFSKASVSIAMKALREGGYITMDDEKAIYLTDKGEALAQQMYERHLLLSEWLVYLGVDRETAVRDACKIEHDLSAKSYEAIKRHAIEIISGDTEGRVIGSRCH